MPPAEQIGLHAGKSEQVFQSVQEIALNYLAMHHASSAGRASKKTGDISDMPCLFVSI